MYYPGDPSASHLDITVLTDSLEVLTPPDTAEIRKVTATMRTEVLRDGGYPEIRLVSRKVTPSADGFHIIGAPTLVGQTRELPIDVTARIGVDTLEAAATFSVKQTDFGIKPFSGGPGRSGEGGGSGHVRHQGGCRLRAVDLQAHAACTPRCRDTDLSDALR